MKTILTILCILSITGTALSQTERVTFLAPKAYPEGVTFDDSGKTFFVSSVKTGTIGTVDQKGGYKIFYQDSTLKSTFGMKIDTRRGRLWICSSDPNFSEFADSSTFKKMARVIVLDLKSKQVVADIDLASLQPGKHFANDLTLDNEGNAYVTDSFSPLIYRIDVLGKAKVFAKSDLFKSVDVGLNGIVYHPQGFLLVAHNTNGIVFRIPVKEPSKISVVRINTFFPGADGLLLDKQNNLILVQNKGVNKIFQLVSTDNWQTASVKAATASEDRFQNPTTATWQSDKLFILNSKLNELSDSTKTPSREFSIQVANLKPVR